MIVRSLVILIVISVIASSSAQYKWTDNAGNTYEIVIQDPSRPNNNQQRPNYNQRPGYPQQQYPQQQYPQQQYPQQQYSQQQYPQQQYPQQQNPQQQYPGFHNPQYPQQQTPGITVSNAEWVCTNQKTNDMMVITSDDLPSRFNGQDNNNKNNNPGQNVIPETTQQPIILTTTTTEKPIWADIFPGKSTRTTTEKPFIWTNDQQPQTSTTTPKPFNPNWPAGDGNSQKGFTVIEPNTTPKTIITKPPTTTTTTTATYAPINDYDDGPIKIEFGK